MKISSNLNSGAVKYNFKNKTIKNIEQKPQNLTSSPFVEKSYPKNYYISFSGRTLAELYSNCSDVMPQTVKDLILELKKTANTKDYEKLMHSQALKEIQKHAFEELEYCFSVKEIQETFPNEKYFQELKTMDEVENKTASFKKIQALLKEEGDIFENSEDITTFIVKRMFLESKTIEKIKEEFKSLVKSEELKSLCDRYFSKDYLFADLGIKYPDGRTYGTSLRYSDPDFSAWAGELIKQSKRGFTNLTPEEAAQRLEKLLEGSEKEKIATMDAWNHCSEMRKELSSFIIKNYAHEESSKNIFSSYDRMIKNAYDSEYKFDNTFKQIMKDFWKTYPEFKAELGIQIIKAQEKYDKIALLGDEAKIQHKNDVILESRKIRKEIQESRKKYNDYQNAREIIYQIAQKGNPFLIKNFDTDADFSKLFLNSFNAKEMEILAGDDSTSEYKALFPEEIKEKLRNIQKQSEYKKLLNTQIFALLYNIAKECNFNISNINAQDAKLLNSIFSQIKENKKEIDINGETIKFSKDFNPAFIYRTYNQYKRNLNTTEEILAKEVLFNYCELDEENKEKAYELLSQQGSYIELIHDDEFKHLVLTMFWSEFDNQNGTEFNKEVQENFKKDSNYKEKMDVIEEFDWSDFTLDF